MEIMHLSGANFHRYLVFVGQFLHILCIRRNACNNNLNCYLQLNIHRTYFYFSFILSIYTYSNDCNPFCVHVSIRGTFFGGKYQEKYCTSIMLFYGALCRSIRKSKSKPFRRSFLFLKSKPLQFVSEQMKLKALEAQNIFLIFLSELCFDDGQALFIILQ